AQLKIGDCNDPRSFKESTRIRLQGLEKLGKAGPLNLHLAIQTSDHELMRGIVELAKCRFAFILPRCVLVEEKAFNSHFGKLIRGDVCSSHFQRSVKVGLRWFKSESPGHASIHHLPSSHRGSCFGDVRSVRHDHLWTLVPELGEKRIV